MASSLLLRALLLVLLVQAAFVESIPPPPSCIYTTYGPYGGTGGTSWNDNSFTAGQTCGAIYPSVIEVYSGTYIDQITIFYYPNSQSSGPHGGSGGTYHEFSLSIGEYITNVSITYGDLVESVAFLTTEGRSFYTGGTGPNAWKSAFQANEYVSTFLGAAGEYLDNLGVTTWRLPATDP